MQGQCEPGPTGAYSGESLAQELDRLQSYKAKMLTPQVKASRHAGLPTARCDPATSQETVVQGVTRPAFAVVNQTFQAFRLPVAKKQPTVSPRESAPDSRTNANRTA